MMYDLQTSLEEITGMHALSLELAAGAHGEWTAVMMIRDFHEANGDFQRTKVIVPDSAHGTNPASVTFAGFQSVDGKSNVIWRFVFADFRLAVCTSLAAMVVQ